MNMPTWKFLLAVAFLLGYTTSVTKPLAFATPVKQKPGSSGNNAKSLDKGPLIPADGLISLVEQKPQSALYTSDGNLLLDFGRVAFGNLKVVSQADDSVEILVHFGEKLDGNAIDRRPPGTVRYFKVKEDLLPNTETICEPPRDKRNTQQGSKGKPPAVLTPPAWGVITPFRWIEIEGLSDPLANYKFVRQAALPKGWDYEAASFESSNKTLNEVWELCRYSIEATLFTGLYVDGDRERIPYEADAYINQISHYYTEGNPRIARQTFDWLMKHPTWPTEWAMHMVFMAHADWMQTGDVNWLTDRYEDLKAKTLMDRLGTSGLIHSNPKQVAHDDIVDWPKSERDGYVFMEINTVVNAFHIASVERMAELAKAVGKENESTRFLEHAQRLRMLFNQQLFDAETGSYRDGLGTNHASLHANFFPLAFGIVKEEDRPKITQWLASRGMRCSVYGAQYYLESLFLNGADSEAIDLMIAPGKRSWRHMLESDATITWEAWDVEFKPNLDWNHAWGAAPANLLPRFVLGVEPLKPGWQQVKIAPLTSGLGYARGKVPTPHGPVRVDWDNEQRFIVKLELPEGIKATVEIPAGLDSENVYLDSKMVDIVRNKERWLLVDQVDATCRIEIR